MPNVAVQQHKSARPGPQNMLIFEVCPRIAGRKQAAAVRARHDNSLTAGLIVDIAAVDETIKIVLSGVFRPVASLCGPFTRRVYGSPTQMVSHHRSAFLTARCGLYCGSH